MRSARPPFHAILLRVFGLVFIASMLIASCEKSSRTFVLVRFEGNTTPEIPIAAIQLAATLSSVPQDTTFTATTESGISLPSTAYLEIGEGEGSLHLHAIAQSANGAMLGEGNSDGNVTRGKTSTLVVQFFPATDSTDAGVPADGSWKDPPGSPDSAAPAETAETPVIPGTGGTILGTGGVIGSGGVVASGGSPTDATLLQGGATGTATLVSAPEALTFGPTPVGSNGGAQILTLTNQGTAPTGTLNVHSLDSAQFPIVANNCNGLSLKPNTSCVLSVGFKPSTSTTVATALVVVSPAIGTLQILVSGQGTSALSALELTPLVADFGTVDIASGGRTVVFTVTNTGNTLSGVLATSSGVNAPAFHLEADECAGTILSPGMTCNFSVAFKPISASTFSTEVSVQSNPNVMASVTVRGVGKRLGTVSVQLTGTGKGTIQAAGMTCSETVCKTTVDITESGVLPTVVLQATPDANSTFGGYSGATCGLAARCSLKVSGAISVSARFDLR